MFIPQSSMKTAQVEVKVKKMFAEAISEAEDARNKKALGQKIRQVVENNIEKDNLKRKYELIIDFVNVQSAHEKPVAPS